MSRDFRNPVQRLRVQEHAASHFSPAMRLQESRKDARFAANRDFAASLVRR
ncbi:MAG: hypothetical protein HOA17_02600 [Candidatus Melainabacteria bacterium]|nr:hypothetical protein [Candidatus Melainabacteria bacterium]